jgi:hypothetical protein
MDDSRITIYSIPAYITFIRSISLKIPSKSETPKSAMPYTLNPNGYINPTSTSDSGHVEVDPSAPGTVMRGALAFEAMANAIGGTWMVFFPQRFLNLLVSSPMQITGAAVTWTQLTGSLVYALATPVIMGIPNSRRGIESRAPTYYTLAAGEVGVVAVAMYKAFVFGDSSGWSRSALLAVCATLLPTLAWRFYVLFWRPEWIGRYRELSSRKAQ